jgi:hypothetical protein
VVNRVVEDVFVGIRVLLLRFDQYRVEAASEHVVAAPMAFVEGPRVGAVEVAHAVGEVGRGCFDDEVVVVPHEAANVDAPAVAALDAPDDVGPDDPVRVVEDDPGLVVSSGRDVVDRAGREVTARAAHRSNVPGWRHVPDAVASFVTGLVRTRDVPGTRPGTPGRCRMGRG